MNIVGWILLGVSGCNPVFRIPQGTRLRWRVILLFWNKTFREPLKCMGREQGTLDTVGTCEKERMGVVKDTSGPMRTREWGESRGESSECRETGRYPRQSWYRTKVNFYSFTPDVCVLPSPPLNLFVEIFGFKIFYYFRKSKSSYRRRIVLRRRKKSRGVTTDDTDVFPHSHFFIWVGRSFGSVVSPTDPWVLTHVSFN